MHGYRWGEGTITYHRCGNCGCTTHYSRTESDGTALIAVNCRMASIEQMNDIPVRDFDGLLTWSYVDGKP